MTRQCPAWLPRGLSSREQQQYASEHGIPLLRILWACGEIVDLYRLLRSNGVRTTVATVGIVDYCDRPS